MPSFSYSTSPGYHQSLFVFLQCISNLHILSMFPLGCLGFFPALLKHLFIRDINYFENVLSLNVFLYPIDIYHFMSSNSILVQLSKFHQPKKHGIRSMHA